MQPTKQDGGLASMNWYLAEMLVRERESEHRREAEQDRLAAMLREHGAAPTHRVGHRVAFRAGRLSMVLTLRWAHRA